MRVKLGFGYRLNRSMDEVQLFKSFDNGGDIKLFAARGTTVKVGWQQTSGRYRERQRERERVRFSYSLVAVKSGRYSWDRADAIKMRKEEPRHLY